jgi:hypothetical protein
VAALEVRRDPPSLPIAHLVRRAALQRLVAHLDHLELQHARKPTLVVGRGVRQRAARPADGDDPDQVSSASSGGSCTSGRSRMVSRADHLE